MDSSDFQLKFVNSYFCDLKLLKSREVYGESVIEKWENTIYGIPIATAIRTITTYRAAKRFEKTSLTEFLKAWKEEFNVANKEVCALKKSLD